MDEDNQPKPSIEFHGVPAKFSELLHALDPLLPGWRGTSASFSVKDGIARLECEWKPEDPA